ncbi:hypothetical protein [Streptomyces sp. NPDC058614]|uniref:hypothetical protein n=1 Tax=Streptomyces sp. NPDC058614 TaxID=3346557 RepID=UPI0036600FF2
MTEPESLRADLIISNQVAREEEQPLTAALSALGVTTSVRVLPPRRAAESLTWLILIALPLQGFLQTLGDKAAEDGYRLLQKAFRSLRRPTAAAVPPPPVVLQDPATGLRIVLDHDLPDEGYQRLLAVDLTQYHLGPLHYDRAQGRWRSVPDEAQLR